MTAPARPPEDADSTRASDTNRAPQGAGVDSTSRPVVIQTPVLQPGSLLGTYRVIEELGKGGMGAVYLALDTRLNRKLALKVMLPEYATNATVKERFLREGVAVATLKSDHIVGIYSAGEQDGVLFLAMELIKGKTLDSWRETRPHPLAVEEILWVARDLLTGLAAAHAEDISHRDIKPNNLIVEDSTGRLKILDFGLARAAGENETLTKAGQILGTAAFMSPEQARGGKLEGKNPHARGDLFSAGTVLYWLVAGRSPFMRDSMVSTLHAVAYESPPPLIELPAPLCNFIARLMAPNRDNRPADATAALAELRVVEQQLAAPLPEPLPLSEPEFEEADPPPAKRNRLPAFLAAAAVALLVVIVVLVVRGKGPKDVAQSGNDPTPTPTPPPPPAVVQPPQEPRRPHSTAQVLTLIRQDIDAHPGPKVADALPARLYLFAPHLASGSSLPEPERVAYRAALDALATHLKPGGQLFRPLDPDRTVFAVEPTGKFRWPDGLLVGYPYGLTYDQNDATRPEDTFVRAHTGLVAYVRADWFLQYAVRRLSAGEAVFGTTAPPPAAVKQWASAWAAGRVDLATAADEIGVDRDRIKLAIRNHDPLTNAFGLGPLTEGKSVERGVWQSLEFAASGFQELARELNAGTPVRTE